ncbi:hypothetical protein [Ralstonia phage RSP15]|uniref:hypothetical protein n=1 Tax=Ralstonia phage RSP15 TaxID=1785960 RepID=UPI00074D450C|nr:hypothetical protein BH754_gp125 [Ralstonia phage RSP15]BAU40181.1 hypothetical protein [Ralstonia phage RSP15]
MGKATKKQHLIGLATQQILGLRAIYEKMIQEEGDLACALELQYLILKLEAWQNKHTTKKIR